MNVASAARLSIGVLAGFLLLVGGGRDALPARARPRAAPDVESLKQRISAILERGRIPGAGIALASRSGPVWVGGVGTADLSTGRPVTPDTPFRLGSVTKNFTALALSQLVEQGRLSLEAHLADVAPEVPFQNPWEATRPVTLGQLLEHTAGFDFVRFNDDMETSAQPRPLLDALALNPNARTSRWPPGTRMAYSNEGYEAAGYVIEKVTGRAYDDVVTTSIFGPLDMRNSAMRLTPAIAETLAQGYIAGRPAPYVEDMQRPAANLIASPEDMSQYLLMWLNRGQWNGHRVLSEAGIGRMEVRRTLPYAGPDEQYGLGTDTAQFDGFVAHGHTGTTDGFAASFRYFPSEGLGWVVMLNDSTMGRVPPEVEDELASFLLQDRTSAPPPAYIPQPDEVMALAGTYHDAAPGLAIMAPIAEIFGGVDIQERDGTYWIRQTDVSGVRSLLGVGEWEPLISVGPGAFRRIGETVSSLFFVPGQDGRGSLVTPQGYFEKVPSWQIRAIRGVLIGAVGVLLSAVVLVPLSAVISVVSGLPVSDSGARVIPSFAAILPLIAWLVLRTAPAHLGQVGPASATIFAVSAAFPLLAALSLVTSLRTPVDQTGLLLKSYLVLVSAAAGGLAVFAARAGWLALRTWSW